MLAPGTAGHSTYDGEWRERERGKGGKDRGVEGEGSGKGKVVRMERTSEGVV